MKERAGLLTIALHISLGVIGQTLQTDKTYYLAAVGFWNVENLYDTLNDQWKNDEDFTPVGVYAWSGDRYKLKIKHLAEAISLMAVDASQDGLAMIGLCEVENKSVLKDLVNDEKLLQRNYQCILNEGPDARGVDPAFLYNPTYFKLKRAVSYPVRLLTDSFHKTRDILVVSGYFLGESWSLLVNHWPSRRGGEMQSRPNRNHAARIARAIADSIRLLNPTEKIVIMGDFNDDPVNESIKKNIICFSEQQEVGFNNYFNPMETLYKQGIGSLAWDDTWNLFDQIILNKNLVSGNFETWQYYKVRVFNKSFLKSDFGNFKGYPFRTFNGTNYTAGYSDHFPVYILLAKEKTK